MMNLDQAEIAHFNAHADWWDEHGAYRLLHQLNPLRLSFIAERTPLAQQKILDIGCGGGILTASLAQQGGICTGIDLSEAALDAARQHAAEHQLTIDYHLIAAEAWAETHGGRYDIVTCLEMLEHVPDPTAIIQACSQVLKPGGWLFLSTINRTFKAYLETIVGAEYLLKLLPKGTHHYNKFIKPSELLRVTRQYGLRLSHMAGIQYHVFNHSFRLTPHVSNNYLVALQKA